MFEWALHNIFQSLLHVGTFTVVSFLLFSFLFLFGLLVREVFLVEEWFPARGQGCILRAFQIPTEVQLRKVVIGFAWKNQRGSRTSTANFLQRLFSAVSLLSHQEFREGPELLWPSGHFVTIPLLSAVFCFSHYFLSSFLPVSLIIQSRLGEKWCNKWVVSLSFHGVIAMKR